LANQVAAIRYGADQGLGPLETGFGKAALPSLYLTRFLGRYLAAFYMLSPLREGSRRRCAGVVERH
jgi:hypothetical protein